MKKIGDELKNVSGGYSKSSKFNVNDCFERVYSDSNIVYYKVKEIIETPTGYEYICDQWSVLSGVVSKQTYQHINESSLSISKKIDYIPCE